MRTFLGSLNPDHLINGWIYALRSLLGQTGEKAELLSAFCSVYVKEYDYELMQ